MAVREGANSVAGTIVDDAAASQATNVRAYPDGSLRTPDGKFASVNGMPAPGTVNASNYADFLTSNGINVVGTELEVAGPLGVRKYDIMTLNFNNTLFGIEIKSGGAMPTPYQEFSDLYVNQFGAVGRGRIAGPTTGNYRGPTTGDGNYRGRSPIRMKLPNINCQTGVEPCHVVHG